MNLRSVSIFCLAVVAATVCLCDGQTAYFADGYHGGIYGHYPLWQTKFMVDNLLDNPDWKINLEIEPETWDVVRDQDADNFKRLQEYYENTGRFGRIEFVNPAYAQPYCYNISGESIIRHFQYGMSKIGEYFPEVNFTAYSVEEPCFTSCLPQILTSLGFKYAVLRNPDTCWGGYTSAFGKDLVNWKASDGSSILTVPRYACEELVKGSTWQTASWNNSKDFIQACFDSGVQYPVGMCFQDAGWRHGPWLENVIHNFYRPTEYVTWSDYIEMIAPKVTPKDWNFSVEDVKPGLVWGSQVLQKLAQEVRYTENQLIMAEKMSAFSAVFQEVSYPKKELDEAWRTLMLSQHHDCWIVPYNGRRGQTWADKVAQWTRQSDDIADGIIEDAFRNIQVEPSEENYYIKVFNTLGISRTDLVAIRLPGDIDPAECQIQDDQGYSAKSQIIMADDGRKELLFEATVPAMGYSTFTVLNKEVQPRKMDVKRLDDSSFQIDTNYYTAVIDPSKGGTITSLLAKRMGNVQLVETGKGLNNLRGFFYDDSSFISGEETLAKISVIESGPLLVRVKVESQINEHPYTQMITFFDNNPRIDFDLKIDWQGQPGIGAYSQEDSYIKEHWEKAFYNDKYKLQVQFPVKGPGSTVFKNAPFDVAQSRLQDTFYDSWGTIKHNVILNWVDVTDEDSKVALALFSDHTTSYINGDEMPLGLTVQYIGRALWGRHYGVDGPTHIKYAILPHNGQWDQYGIHAQSTAWNEPLLASVAKGRPMETKRSLMEVETKGIEVASVVMDNDALLIRLFNAESASETATINLHCGFDKIQLVQLDGKVLRDITPLSGDNNIRQIKLPIPRFGIRTIRLAKKNPS